MNHKTSSLVILEAKIIELLNKLKENHLDLKTLREQNTLLENEKKELKSSLQLLKEENQSLTIANNLLGSNEGNTQTKSKINSLIKEVDYCIAQITEMN
jgi:benzoyl-CoA reductase/2-hydroxyglutaryl-CoA dehydratase subunit BcrC/BadD/HgdB